MKVQSSTAKRRTSSSRSESDRPRASRWRPAYATISSNGGLYTLTYYPQDSSSRSLQGYGRDVFRDGGAEGTGIPLVDYQTMNFDGYSCRTVIETCSHCFGTDPLYYVRMADWLADVQARGAVVTKL